MQWLVDNGYSIVPGNVFGNGHGNLFFTELFALCGKVPPANWKWSELLEEVAVKCEHEDSEPCDPFKTDDPNPLAI